jgi:hypothetical protein
MYARIYMRTWLCLRSFEYACVYTYTYIHKYIHKYIHAYIHIHIYIYIYIYLALRIMKKFDSRATLDSVQHNMTYAVCMYVLYVRMIAFICLHTICVSCAHTHTHVHTDIRHSFQSICVYILYAFHARAHIHTCTQTSETASRAFTCTYYMFSCARTHM